jgi:hypothetical protein
MFGGPPMGNGGMPFQSGANSGGVAPPQQRVGWQNKGNRNPHGFGGPPSRGPVGVSSPANPTPAVPANPDSGGGSSISMRSPGLSSSAVTPPRGGGRTTMGGFANLM